jgi:hypothetical protein
VWVLSAKNPPRAGEIGTAIKILREEGNLDAIERINRWWAPERDQIHEIPDYDS